MAAQSSMPCSSCPAAPKITEPTQLSALVKRRSAKNYIFDNSRWQFLLDWS
jgi:hypothetical protein